MAYAKGKNELNLFVLELAYSQSQVPKESLSEDEQYKGQFIEFFPEKNIDTKNEGFRFCHPDPDGLLTSCGFGLASMGYLVPTIISRWGLSNFAFKMTDAGKELYEDKNKLEREFPTAKGNFAFVIMSFSDDSALKDSYSLAIKPVIEDLGFSCIRVDEIEHNRRITDRVVECIGNAKFIVADLTEQRPNCYYELGYAHALDKEVIHIAREGEPLHFDIKDYNFIIYPNATELKKRLKDRIENTVVKKRAKEIDSSP